MPTEEAQLQFIESNRRFVNPAGIYRADAVFVPLEDGDRCQALVKMGKSVITVDLNPMSRTSVTSTISIVDNVVRTLPALLEKVDDLRSADRQGWRDKLAGFDNSANLTRAERAVRSG